MTAGVDSKVSRDGRLQMTLLDNSESVIEVERRKRKGGGGGHITKFSSSAAIHPLATPRRSRPRPRSAGIVMRKSGKIGSFAVSLLSRFLPPSLRAPPPSLLVLMCVCTCRNAPRSDGRRTETVSPSLGLSLDRSSHLRLLLAKNRRFCRRRAAFSSFVRPSPLRKYCV